MTTCSARDLALLFSIGERHFRKLVEAGHIPAPVSRGLYDRDESIRAYLRYLDGLEAARDEPARIRLMRARTRLLEIKLAERESQLVRLSEVKEEARRLNALAVRTLDAMRVRVVPQLAAATDPLACDKLLAAEIRRVCAELSGAN